jgi:PAS domain S-box-containing protein
MEEVLRESEEKYRKQFEEALDAIFLADADTGIILDCNRAATELVGREKSELIGKHQRILHPPEKIKGEFSTTFKQHLKEKEGRVLETQVITKNGEIKDVAIKANLFELQGKKMLQGIFRDITERKKTEKAIRESQQKFEQLFMSNPEAAVYVDPNERVLNVSPRFTELFGYSFDEVKGKFLDDFVVPEDRRKEALMLAQKGKEGYVYYETVRKNKKGSLIPVTLSSAPIALQGQHLGDIVLYKDITERKKTEMSLRESQQKFEGLFMGNPEAAAYLDPDYRIRDINPRFEELFGYSLADVQGKPINDLVVPDDRKKEGEALDKEARKGYVYRNTVRRKKDRSLVQVSVSAAPITVRDKVAGIVAIYHDISDLKNAEKKLDMMNEKLRVVGGLTRHDVRNKLSVVTGNAYLLRRKLAGNAEALEHLAGMENAVRKAESIFEFARIYEQLDAERLANLNVGKAVDEAASLFPDLKGIRIVNECHGLTVLADSLLRQLVYNLIDNTLKYGEKTGQIRIYSKTPSADKLELVYEDDGVGIPNDIRSSLFKEGFTLGKGTGYGLFMMKRICEVYGWTIRETGKQGKGAQFTIDIPKAKPDGKPNYKLG